MAKWNQSNQTKEESFSNKTYGYIVNPCCMIEYTLGLKLSYFKENPIPNEINIQVALKVKVKSKLWYKRQGAAYA